MCLLAVMEAGREEIKTSQGEMKGQMVSLASQISANQERLDTKIVTIQEKMAARMSIQVEKMEA